MSRKITPLCFFSSNIIVICWSERVTNFGEFRVIRSNFVKFLMSILKRQVNSSSIFSSKGSYESPNIDTFQCSGENLPNSSRHFLNHKLVFFQILHHSSVSLNITPLHFLQLNIKYFAQKEPIKVQILYYSSGHET